MNVDTIPRKPPSGPGPEAGPAPDEEPLAAYISSIADRIKATRIRRGMTRKLLSSHSGVSERYLSQIESGRANLSMALLFRVARAMDVEVQELLPDCRNCSQVPAPIFRIISKLDTTQIEEAGRLLEREILGRDSGGSGVALIGLRGAGKSSIGKALACRFGVPFVNLVHIVEEISGMSVGELFSLGGQKAYRRYEHQALEKVIHGFPEAVLEVGGSLVTRAETFQLLQHHYYTVWVKAAPEEHMERVVAQGDLRPMQGNEDAMDDLKRILVERAAEYGAAQRTLDTTGRPMENCLEELAETVDKHLGWRAATE